MAKFTFIKADGTELDYATKSVVVEKQVTVKVSKSLWKGVGGKRRTRKIFLQFPR